MHPGHDKGCAHQWYVHVQVLQSENRKQGTALFCAVSACLPCSTLFMLLFWLMVFPAVSIGSTSAYFPSPLASAYAASKFAVRGYSDAVRVELAPFGVRVLHVAPGGWQLARTQCCAVPQCAVLCCAAHALCYVVPHSVLCYAVLCCPIQHNHTHADRCQSVCAAQPGDFVVFSRLL